MENNSKQDQISPTSGQIRYANYWERNLVASIDGAYMLVFVVFMSMVFGTIGETIISLLHRIAPSINTNSTLFSLSITFIGFLIEVTILKKVSNKYKFGLSATGLMKNSEGKIIYKDANKEISTKVKILGLILPALLIIITLPFLTMSIVGLFILF